MTHIHLSHQATLPLFYHADCALLGVTRSGEILAEEIYGDDFFAQYLLSPSGQVLASVDEDYGDNEPVRPLPEPDDLITHRPAALDHPLNFSGPRLRGLRELEHLADMVQPLSLPDKMALINRLQLGIPAMMLFGLAESRVLSEATIADDCWIICRRVRLAIALPSVRHDSVGEAYDYDTLTLHIAHFTDRHDNEPEVLLSGLDGLGGVRLSRPLDCLVVDERLYIAEGGCEQQRSAIHVWTIGPKS